MRAGELETQLTVRSLAISDIEAATQSGLAAWLDAIAPCLKDFTYKEIPMIERAFISFLYSHSLAVSSEQNRLLVAEVGDKIAGFIHFDSVYGIVSDLWIAPDWQRHGLGTALLCKARNEIKASGRKALALEVLAENNRALAFYQRQGLAEVGRKRYFDALLHRELEKILLRQNLT